MARIRTIKPEFWTDEKLTECSLSARLLFIGTWNFADDNGNLDRSAKQIKARVFPIDAIDCEPLLQELLTQGLLIEYSVSGKTYLKISGFDKHQLINRPSKPTCPPCDENATLHEHSVSAHDGKEGKGREEERKGRERKGKEKTGAAFALPDWIDKITWDLWLKTRKGRKMIPEQMQAQVSKLSKWRDAGLDHAKALHDAATAGWQGLFEPKPSNVKGGQLDKDQAREGARARLFGEQNATE
jgi:hypothetical protein